MGAIDKVILIMTDTQRWDMCGCYRETGLLTPNIDRLAAGGMRFERAYCAQPVCQPARAAIFTGQFPHSCAGWANGMGISDNTKTLGQRLRDEGVHTAYVGKWHLDGGDYFGLGRCPDGWDENYWYDMRLYLEGLTEYERRISRDASHMNKNDFPGELTFGRRCADKAVEFLRNHGDERFFLTVSFDEPHSPCMCPPPYSSMYEGYEFPKSPNVYDTLEDKPDYQKLWAGKSLNEDKGSLRIRGKHFFGCNSFIDSQIGRVIDAAEFLAPGAVVIYTSDHGDFLSSHSLLAKGCAVYDEAARVPFIISGGTAKPGSVGKNPVSHINIAPTVMELMGCDIPEMMEGPSLVSELADPSQRTNEFVFIEFGRFSLEHDGWGGFQPMRAVFDGRHKLAVHLLSTDELYDIESDPYEMRNLIYDADRTAVRDRLHDTLLAHMNLTRDPFRGYYWERRPWRTDAARATWPYTGMMRDRHEDERYERRPLDYGTGIPLAHHTHEGNNGFWI